ncbi:hypothetical protein [Nonomuraea sediminis]|uniref:hypothetical protein n=1 Tax=Nonomuraea sediminis TaxID=2835864 RepID=UPI001BDC91D5|nr:hypothetical protein [Nonomuraea sediminis]
MALSQDAWFNDSYVKTMRQTVTIDLGNTTPGTFKGALWTGSVTPDFSQSNPAYGTSPWNSGETSGPGYSAGGNSLTVISFAELAGIANKVGWRFNSTSWTSATISADGLLIYAPGISNRAFLLRYFGQTYTSSNGTFGLAWDSTGAWRTVLRATP